MKPLVNACLRRESGSHVLQGICLLLQGFAYVKYNNSISAASAVERYNGFELPAGSGLRLKVRSAAALTPHLSRLCRCLPPLPYWVCTPAILNSEVQSVGAETCLNKLKFAGTASLTQLKSGSDAGSQVMYAENLQVRQGGKGTPPLVPSRSLSARSDSTSSILQPRSGKQHLIFGPWPRRRATCRHTAISPWRRVAVHAWRGILQLTDANICPSKLAVQVHMSVGLTTFDLRSQCSAGELESCRLCRAPEAAVQMAHMYTSGCHSMLYATGDMISPGVQSTNMGRNESTPDLHDARYAEVAAIQNSLAHMTMPHHSDLGAYGNSTPPPNRAQRSPLLSPSGMQPRPSHLVRQSPLHQPFSALQDPRSSILSKCAGCTLSLQSMPSGWPACALSTSPSAELVPARC